MLKLMLMQWNANTTSSYSVAGLLLVRFVRTEGYNETTLLGASKTNVENGK